MIDWKPGIWYFMHPLTCRDDKGNTVPEAEEAHFTLCCYRTAQLVEAGYIVFSPIAQSYPVNSFYIFKEEIPWYDFDNEIILRTPSMGGITAPGYEHSWGCREEVKLFTELRRPVLHWEEIFG